VPNSAPDDRVGGVNDDVLRRFVGSLPDAIVVVDRTGTIRYWNSGAERIFGHPAATAIGQSLDLIVPERLRQRHWDGFHHAVATGTSRYGPDQLLAVPAVAAGGRPISIEFTVALVPGADGSTSYVGALIRDVTERRRTEQELRRRLAAAEGGDAAASA
jgi:PAS domain S-box-containing protein